MSLSMFKRSHLTWGKQSLSKSKKGLYKNSSIFLRLTILNSIKIDIHFCLFKLLLWKYFFINIK